MTTLRPPEYTKQHQMIFQNTHLGKSIPLRLIQPLNKGGVGAKGTDAAQDNLIQVVDNIKNPGKIQE